MVAPENTVALFSSITWRIVVKCRIVGILLGILLQRLSATILAGVLCVCKLEVVYNYMLLLVTCESTCCVAL